MPYVLQTTRKIVDSDINLLAAKARDTVTIEARSGISNYIITRLLLGIIQPSCYNEYNTAIGVLECVKQELYRRAVAKYEDKTIEKNGDLTEYEL